MKRIGLIIFLTVLIGLVLNITLINIFYESINIENLKIGLVIVNITILSVIVFDMISKKSYVSHIFVLIIIYGFILSNIVSSLSFVNYLKSNEVVDVIGIVENIEYNSYSHQVEYYLKIKRFDNENAFYSRKVLMLDNDNYLKIGDKVYARLKDNKDDMSYTFGKKVLLSANSIEVQKIGEKFTLNKYAKSMQTIISNRLNHILGVEYGDIVSSFIVGTDFTDSENKQSFINTGIYHIMAISGLHVGIFGGFIVWILNKFLVYRDALKVSIPIMIFYGLITGFSYSTSRAIILFIVATVSRIIAFKHDNLNTLGIAGVIILLINPFAIFNLGYIYSFTITFGLVLTVPTVIFVIKMMLNLSKFKQYKILDYFATIITAQLYYIPISLYLFNYLSTYVIIVNALTIFVVPVLFIFSLLGIIFYGTIFSSVFAIIVRFLVKYILLVANWFESLHYAVIEIGQVKLYLVLLCYITLFSVSYYATRNFYEVNNGYFRKTKLFTEE